MKKVIIVDALQNGGDFIMKGHLNSEFGEILVDADVIASYTGSVAVGCFGIVGMAAYSMKDGLYTS